MGFKRLVFVLAFISSGHVTAPIARRELGTPRDTPAWTCQREPGYCVTNNARNRTAGAIKLGNVHGNEAERQSACLKKCLAYEGATGCELAWGRNEGICYVHTRHVTVGSDTSGSYCWIFANCEGALPLYVGNFENHVYDGTPEKNKTHYVRISYVKGEKYFTWRNMNDESCSLFPTDAISRLRVGEGCPYYKDGFRTATFTTDGVWGPGNGLYERAGTQFVGGWTITSSNSTRFEYTFSEDGTITVKPGREKSDLAASDDAAFPPSEGWYMTTKITGPTTWEYMRVKPDGSLEIRYFCSESWCRGIYNGARGYCCHGVGVKHRWMRQAANVCFRAKGDRPGIFRMRYNGNLTAIRLVHRSGYVGCSTKARSYWGCDNVAGISIAITDNNKRLIFPKDLPRDGWYALSPYHMNSTEIILDTPVDITHVTYGKLMKLWYAEDLMNNAETDNVGTSCVDVYARIEEILKQPDRRAIVRISLTLDEKWNDQSRGSEIDQSREFEMETGDNYMDYTLYGTTIQDGILWSLDKSVSLNISSEMRVGTDGYRKSDGGLTIVDAYVSYPGDLKDLKLYFCQQMQEAIPNIKLSNYTIIGEITYYSPDCCFKEIAGDDTYKGRYTYNVTLTDEAVTIPCKYNANNTLTRSCKGDYNRAKWMEPNLNRCFAKSKTTMKLRILNVTSHCTPGIPCKSSGDLAETLNKIVANASVITTSKDISYIADITSIIVGRFNDTRTVTVTKNILETVGKVMDTNPTLVAKAEEADTAATSILRNIESFSKKLGHSISSVGQNITVSRKNVAMQVAKVTKQDIKIYSHLEPLSNVSVGVDDFHLEITSTFLASIYIPSTTFESNEGVVYAQAYLKSTLFVDHDQIMASQNGTTIVNPVQSLVLSVSLGTNTSSLENPIILQFRKKYSVNRDSVCSFWQFGEGKVKGRWNSTGCKLMNETSDGTVKCQCTHLTNFALLMDVYQTGSNPESLKYVTWIGCAISLVGLVLTIVIFSFFRKLRAKLPSKILICLCVSLVIFLVIFLAGIEQAKTHRTACQVVAGLLHYFLLTSFMWMCVAAVNLYQLLVLVFRSSDENKFLIRSSIAAWGLPVVVVVITAAVKPENLGNENICFPLAYSAYFGVLLPMLIILLVNFSVLIAILVKFARTPPVTGNKEQKRNLRLVRIAFSISILLGLCWILAIFAVKDAEYVFQLLFCIFNSLQGFFIFILYTFTNDAVLKELRRYIERNIGSYSVSSQNAKTTSTSPTSNEGVAMTTRSSPTSC